VDARRPWLVRVAAGKGATGRATLTTLPGVEMYGSQVVGCWSNRDLREALGDPGVSLGEAAISV
jgi:hypothetical protein